MFGRFVQELDVCTVFPKIVCTVQKYHQEGWVVDFITSGLADI